MNTKRKVVFFFVALAVAYVVQAAEPMKMTTYYPTPYASYSTVTVGETNIGTESGGGALATQNLNVTTLEVGGSLTADNVTQLKARTLRVGPAASTSGGKLKASKIRLNADLEANNIEAAQAHIVDTIDFGGKVFPYAKAAVPSAETLSWKEITFKGLDGKKKKGKFLVIDVENTCSEHAYAVPYGATEEISQYEIEVVAACQFLGYPVPSDIFVTDDVDVIDETFRYCEALIEANLCDDNEEVLYTCETLEPKRCIDVMSVPGGTVDLTAETGEWNWIPFNGFQGIALPYTPGKRSAAASTSSGTGSTTPQLRAGGYTQFPPGVELEIGPGGGGIQAVLPCEYWQGCASRPTEYERQLCARMHNIMCPTTLQLPDTIKLRMVSCCDEYTPPAGSNVGGEELLMCKYDHSITVKDCGLGELLPQCEDQDGYNDYTINEPDYFSSGAWFPANGSSFSTPGYHIDVYVDSHSDLDWVYSASGPEWPFDNGGSEGNVMSYERRDQIKSNPKAYGACGDDSWVVWTGGPMPTPAQIRNHFQTDPCEDATYAAGATRAQCKVFFEVDFSSYVNVGAFTYTCDKKPYYKASTAFCEYR
ncbi:hypothetical protein AAIR98_001106 [Elusimicrobium simillimum]|uniref:hypothetical protein n=1 Tax=Elusimicrobium simillimum TaxID=3143438 RepID=UPI003C6EDE82